MAVFLLSQANDSYTAPVYQYGSSGTVGGDTSYDYYKYFTVPVLLRYTFIPSAEHFHLDGLAGVTIRYFTYTHGYSALYPGNPSYELNGRSFGAGLTLGPAVRYALSPAVELTANGLVNAALGSNYSDRFRDRLLLSVLVGAHYSFGSH